VLEIRNIFEPVARQLTDTTVRAAGGGIDTECACCIVFCNTNSAEISTKDYFAYINKFQF
jgi:hypothetical protein